MREEMSRRPAPRSKPPDVPSGANGCSAAITASPTSRPRASLAPIARALPVPALVRLSLWTTRSSALSSSLVLIALPHRGRRDTPSPARISAARRGGCRTNLARWRNLQQGAVLPGGCRTTLKQDSGQGTAQIRFMRASRRCCRPRRRRCTRGRHPRFAGCVGGINNEDAPRRLCATASAHCDSAVRRRRSVPSEAAAMRISVERSDRSPPDTAAVCDGRTPRQPG